MTEIVSDRDQRGPEGPEGPEGLAGHHEIRNSQQLRVVGATIQERAGRTESSSRGRGGGWGKEVATTGHVPHLLHLGREMRSSLDLLTKPEKPIGHLGEARQRTRGENRESSSGSQGGTRETTRGDEERTSGKREAELRARRLDIHQGLPLWPGQKAATKATGPVHHPGEEEHAEMVRSPATGCAGTTHVQY